MKVKHKAKGYVLGNMWGGGKVAYPTIEIEADTKEEIDVAINESLENGSLDSGMGFESLIGCVMEIETISIVIIDHEEYSRSDYMTESYGELTESQDETLIEIIYSN